MMPGEGDAHTKCLDCGHFMETEVLMSNAGYYIGTFCDNCGPHSRESDYFRTREDAEAELKLWKEFNVKPSARTPGYLGG